MITRPPLATTPSRHDAARLHGPWLALGRIGVITFAVGYLVLLVFAVPVYYQALTTLCAPVETCQAFRLSQLELAAMPGWLTIEIYASYQIALEMVLSLIGLAVGMLILYRVSHTRIGLLAAAIMIFLVFSTEVFNSLTGAVPLVAMIYLLVLAATYGVIVLFVMVFPNGKVEPDWVRRHFPLIVLSLVGIQVLGFSVAALGLVRLDPLFTALWVSAFVFAFGVQVVRYRNYATPEQRQQVKWVLVGIGFLLLNVFLWIFVIEPEWTSPLPGGAPRLTWNLLGGTLSLITAGLFPITLAYSILRRRLWDVDQIINRALVYGSLTVTLTAIYLGTVILLQRVVLSGQDSNLVIAGSTLLIAALFAPLRRRIQSLIDRRFFRSKYDGQKALAAFAATARSQVDLDALTAELLRVVGTTVQPQQLSLWLKPDAGRSHQSETPSSGTAS